MQRVYRGYTEGIQGVYRGHTEGIKRVYVYLCMLVCLAPRVKTHAFIMMHPLIATHTSHDDTPHT